MADYKKFLRDNNVESGILFGEYDSDDKYIISREVREALFLLNKRITEYKQDYILCEAKISDFVIKYKIKVFVDEFESEKYASLYVLENYKSYNNTNINLETFLVNFKTQNNPAFIDKLKEAYRLFTAEDLGDGKDISNSSEILEKLLSSKKNISRNMMLEMGVDNRKYINEILRVLKSMPNFNTRYEALIKKKIASIKAEKNTAKYYALLKQVLDEFIFEHFDEFDEQTKKELERINQMYVLIYMDKKKVVQKNATTKKDVSSSPKKKKAAAKKKSLGGTLEFPKTKWNNSPLPSFNFNYDIQKFDLPKLEDFAVKIGKPQQTTRQPVANPTKRDELTGSYFEDEEDDIFSKIVIQAEENCEASIIKEDSKETETEIIKNGEHGFDDILCEEKVL